MALDPWIGNILTFTCSYLLHSIKDSGSLYCSIRMEGITLCLCVGYFCSAKDLLKCYGQWVGGISLHCLWSQPELGKERETAANTQSKPSRDQPEKTEASVQGTGWHHSLNF